MNPSRRVVCARLRLLLIACWLVLPLLTPQLHAHDHVEVGLSPGNPGQLGLSGPDQQTALYVPPGEPFSGYMPLFPGGVYPVETTFSATGESLTLATGSLPRIEVLSVTGPANALFSFWEEGATSATWSRPTGWTGTTSDRPSIKVYQDNTGYGHIHGRALSVTAPGSYTIRFRALDDTSLRTPSEPKSLTLVALATPPLTLRLTATQALLSFTSRSGLTYDLQVSTDLQTWTTLPAYQYLPGDGLLQNLTDNLNQRPRLFYRLVEYL